MVVLAELFAFFRIIELADNDGTVGAIAHNRITYPPLGVDSAVDYRISLLLFLFLE